MTKLLYTGGTGFLGRNTKPLFDQLYEVTTCGISPDDMLQVDLSKGVPDLPERYDVVLHACGKAHTLPKTEAEKQEFYDVNYQGTVNICNALEKVGVPEALVFISSVAVYGCDYGEMITEDHPLEGSTPYGESKVMAERYLTEWCSQHHVRLGILRPSLLAGKNAPGNLGAMVNTIRKGFYVNIAGGKVVKSILMAEDVFRLFPLLVEKGGVYNVCDTRQPSFGEISASIAKQLGKRKPISIPYLLAWCIAKVGDLLNDRFPLNSYKLKLMTNSLTFSNEKARRELGWEPIDVLEHFKVV